MATFDKRFVHSEYAGATEGETLSNFARADECFRIYKVAMEPGGEHTHYYTIRKLQDEDAMRRSSSLHDPVLVWSR